MEAVSEVESKGDGGLKVSVVIPVNGASELTDRCIESVKKNAGIEHEILVVDDCSKEPYKNEGVAVVRLKEHSGVTKALNVGLRTLRLNYDYVLLLNNDTLPQPGFLKALVDCAESDASIGVVGSTRINSWEPYREAGAGMDLTTGLVHYVKDPEQWKEPIQCIWVPFCSVLLSRACVEYTGLLDEKMVTFNSDNDFCLRAIFMGFCVVVEPKSKVFHYQSYTVKALGLEPYDDQITFAKKWFGPAQNLSLIHI